MKSRTEKSRHSNEKQKGEKKFIRAVKRLLLIILMLFLLGAVTGGTWFYFTYGKIIFDFQSNAKKIASGSKKGDFKEFQTSLVYASDGSLISVLKAEKDVYYLEYNQIPKSAVNAMLATEDRKFYTHGGVDFLANIRASILLIKNKGEIHQGASTITQQLSRIIYLTNEVTWERKITEIFLAAELEKRYSKDQIMEFYLNNIYFANGHYGIQAAAYGYFGKSALELSISEMAFICTIPNNPTLYNPVTNFENTMFRRDKVLEQMRDEGYISEKEYRKAVAEEIILDISRMERKDYAETYTYYCAVRALMKEEGFIFRNEFKDEDDKEQYEEAYYEAYYRIQKSLYTKGYRIYTSIDLNKQAVLQEAVDSALKEFDEVNEQGIYALQGAAACIDNDTGKVVAIIGGRQQEHDGYSLNRAYQSYRQPGSAIKPLIIYTPLFEQGMHPDDIVVDEKFEGSPRNADNSYAGKMTIRRAVESSKNTVAWKLFMELTPEKGLSYLKTMNFAKIVSTDYVPAASLGGLTYGVSAIEMASAYAALANEGIYTVPDCIVQIMDSKGNQLLKTTEDKKKVYERNAALIMTDVLAGVMINGTGHRIKLDGMTSAGKTGTTSSQRDGWFCGYTRYYTTAVWVGYDMPREMKGLAGNTYPGYIYKEFMNQIHAGLKDKKFEKYADDKKVYEEIWGDEERNGYEEELNGDEEAVEGEEESEPDYDEVFDGANGNEEDEEENASEAADAEEGISGDNRDENGIDETDIDEADAADGISSDDEIPDVMIDEGNVNEGNEDNEENNAGDVGESDEDEKTNGIIDGDEESGRDGTADGE